ncbi:hypothetical protein BDZ91DRAFT_768705 [Kalaharituber pfeilii]|nr:hypothetical protein BDZ91DRAFT_768705 [Kalaharituber pfeilii]
MEADEMMDDDLFADLYGDEEAKKDELKSTAVKSTTGSAEKTVVAHSSVQTKAPEKATDPRPNVTAGTNIAALSAHIAPREVNGVGGNEENHQGELQHGKGDSSGGEMIIKAIVDMIMKGMVMAITLEEVGVTWWTWAAAPLSKRMARGGVGGVWICCGVLDWYMGGGSGGMRKNENELED